jgi:purine-nucleoside phosphorylase
MRPSQRSSEIQAAASYILKHSQRHLPEPPRLGLVLGSGLGDFAEALLTKCLIPFSKIPHFPRTSIPGHSGNVVVGQVGNASVACLQGRVHYYEGYEVNDVVFPVRVLGAMRIKRLIVTNAAGAINQRFKPGDLMVIRDHISSFYPNPLVGPNQEQFGPRFPDMTEAYSLRLRKLAWRCADQLKLKLREGIYVGLTGPSYESPAEIRMLKGLGADAVGMSTVPEVIVARHMGMECLGISNITNLAAGISKARLSHQEVLEAGERVKPRLIALLTLLCTEITNVDASVL